MKTSNKLIKVKYFLTLGLFLTFLSTYAQDENGHKLYGEATAQMSVRKSNALGTGIALNAGYKATKMIGTGVGLEMMKLKGHKHLFLPVYADFRYFFPPGVLFQAFFTAQPGYISYSETQTHETVQNSEVVSNSSLTTKGGTYFGTGFGLRGREKLSPTIIVRYSSYGFINQKTGDYYKQDHNTRTGAITVNFGIAF